MRLLLRAFLVMSACGLVGCERPVAISSRPETTDQPTVEEKVEVDTPVESSTSPEATTQVEANSEEKSTRLAGEALLARMADQFERSRAASKAGLSDAKEVFAAALAEAKKSDKRVLVHYGAPWCIFCGLLEECLDENRELLEQDYVLVKIDEDIMKNTDELGAPWGKTPDEGIPWMAIVDTEGKSLITSTDSPTGMNIGHPMETEELDHFMVMLQKTAQRLTPEQLTELRTRWQRQTKVQELQAMEFDVGE